MPLSFIRDTRGAVLVEGVIVLPLFVIVFAAVLYYHQAYSAKLERNNQARSCAWTYSVEGCHKIPEGCNLQQLDEDSFVGIDEGIGAHAEVFTKSASSGVGQERSELGDALGSANTLLLGLVGLREGIVARQSRELKMPSLLGGATRTISGDYAVMCNERKRSAGQLLHEAYCAIGRGELHGCP